MISSEQEECNIRKGERLGQIEREEKGEKNAISLPAASINVDCDRL